MAFSHTSRFAITASTLVVLAGNALAQVGTTGQPLVGGFVLTPLSDTVVVSNPAGPDGGSATLSSPSSATACRIDWPATTDFSNGGACDLSVPNGLSGGVVDGMSINTAFMSGATSVCTVDEFHLASEARCSIEFHGAGSVAFDVLNAQGQVLATGIGAGPRVRWSEATALSSGGGAGKATFKEFTVTKRTRPGRVIVDSSTGPIVCDNAVAVSVRRIVCITSPCPGDGLGITSTVYRTNQPIITKEGAEAIWSLGACDAGQTQCDRPAITTFASAGQMHFVQNDVDGDGALDRCVQVRPPSGPTSTPDMPLGVVFAHEQPVPGVSFKHQKTGHVTLLKRTASTGSSERTVVTEDPITGDLFFTNDYSELGNPDVEVIAYGPTGEVVGTAIVVAGGKIHLMPEVLCPPPSYPTYVFIGPHKIFTGCQGGYYNLVVPGSPTIAGVHTIRMTPVGNTALLTDVKRVAFDSIVTGGTDNDIILGDYRVYSPPSGPSCDTIDFNGDSLFPDDADLVEFLTVLSGGECSTGACNDIDFNNDGLFPDDTDLISFLTVLAGGSCS